MIPIRVTLEGFMSYRERAELNFDGAPLWMLSGPNGAGKSSVFDAITFALYGVHRGGKNEAKELINHHRDTLTVEFDFALGERLFRVRRTLSRKGRSGVQAFALNGAQAQVIAETELKTGFDQWISQTLGLDSNTFTSSVLLQQGRSDALLSADAPTRHRILSQIVDLSAYETLHKGVAERAKFHKTEAEVLNNQLEGIDAIDENEIERLGREAQDARERLQVLAGELQRLAIAHNLCQTYHDKARELHHTQQQFAHAQELLARASEIEARHTRWSELKIALPALKRATKARADQTQNAARRAQAHNDVQNWHDKLANASQQETTARAQRETIETERAQWQEKREIAGEVKDHLYPAVCELEELERARTELARLDREIAQLPDDLATRGQTVRAREAQLIEWKNALPFLHEIVRARNEWAQMRSENQTLRDLQDALQPQLETAQNQLPPLQTAAADATQQLQTAQDALTEARTLWNEEKKRLAKLDEVDGLANCETCGHALTPQHIAQERARRTTEIARLASTCSEVKARVAQWQNVQAQNQQGRTATTPRNRAFRARRAKVRGRSERPQKRCTRRTKHTAKCHQKSARRIRTALRCDVEIDRSFQKSISRSDRNSPLGGRHAHAGSNHARARTAGKRRARTGKFECATRSTTTRNCAFARQIHARTRDATAQ